MRAADWQQRVQSTSPRGSVCHDSKQANAAHSVSKINDDVAALGLLLINIIIGGCVSVYPANTIHLNTEEDRMIETTTDRAK